MLATPCPVLHEALSVWHPHPRAASSIGSYLPSPVPRSHEGEAQLSPVLGPGTEVEVHSAWLPWVPWVCLFCFASCILPP
uniref:Uncharacterized protein n=1 Tax=Phocoena sinus TaxID=42100 RepID=A0A8C9E348_PHOSS